MQSARGQWLGLVGLGCLPFIAAAALGASPTPELQSSVRAATFEVVVPKWPTERLTYEKALPLELIPFVIRNDKYWSIGTAFAVTPDTYVTASHVLKDSIGNQLGLPAIRDGAGHVYVVDRVLAFSGHEDFVLFTVTGAPPAKPLSVAPEHTLDSVVFAVGNALGEGVVIRDGLLTSETPEAQDGRWKWLRFSAAASPGNSGGPLLDAEGRVIGIVLAKSENENLNYALPIERALAARGKPGVVDSRYQTSLPISRASRVSTFKAEFALPAPFGDFARAFQAARLRSAQDDVKRLLDENSAKLFPRGNSAKLLATVYESKLPAIVQQQRDDSWDVTRAGEQSTFDLPPRGLVTTGKQLGVQVFRLRRPAGALDEKFYSDSKASMDMLLQGLALYRQVGAEKIRITSLGVVEHELAYTDHFGRHWQVRSWPLGYVNSHMVCWLLPTPEGYVGFELELNSGNLESVSETLKVLADYFYLSYEGTLPQWAAFLKRPALRPKAFDTLKLDPAAGKLLSYISPRLKLQVPTEVLSIGDESTLQLEMSYYLDAGKLTWDVGGIRLWAEETQKTYVVARRHAKPVDDKSATLTDDWNEVARRGPSFRGVAGHDSEFKNYWIADVAMAPGQTTPGADATASVLYSLGYGTEASKFPRDLADTFALIRGGTQVLER